MRVANKSTVNTDVGKNLRKEECMIINHNASASFARRELKFHAIDNSTSIERLSSGLRINRAGDDASGLALSEKLRTQVRGLRQAERNIEDAISFIQTTESYLQGSMDVLQRIRELAIQSANGIYSAEDRKQIQVEVSLLVDEVNRISSHAEFNGLKMLDGTFAENGEQIMQFHIGANEAQSVRVFIGDMSARGLGLVDNAGGATLSISTPTAANSSLGSVDTALNQLLKQRAELGAYQNRMQMVQRSIAVAAENLAAAESNIRDTNIANEVSNFVRGQILMQASMAMLAQANTQPEIALQLLG